jgi:hypothetical protein
MRRTPGVCLGESCSLRQKITASVKYTFAAMFKK